MFVLSHYRVQNTAEVLVANVQTQNGNSRLVTMGADIMNEKCHVTHVLTGANLQNNVLST